MELGNLGRWDLKKTQHIADLLTGQLSVVFVSLISSRAILHEDRGLLRESLFHLL